MFEINKSTMELIFQYSQLKRLESL